MKPNPVIENLFAYHRGMGRELAEFVVTAAAGEDITPGDLATLTEAARVRMVSDIRENLSGYGAVPELVTAFCAAASEAMAEHLAVLAPAGLSGRA